MKLVQLTEAIPGYLEGEVLNVDDASADSLVKTRKVAKAYNPDAKNNTPAVPHPVAPGAVHIQQVVDASTTPATADTGAATAVAPAADAPKEASK